MWREDDGCNKIEVWNRGNLIEFKYMVHMKGLQYSRYESLIRPIIIMLVHQRYACLVVTSCSLH